MISPLLRSEREQIADAVLAAAANAEAARGLVLSVRGSSITVSRRETELSLTYEKPPDHPNLELTHLMVAHETKPAVSKFRALAFQAAVYKARELGWIA